MSRQYLDEGPEGPDAPPPSYDSITTPLQSEPLPHHAGNTSVPSAVQQLLLRFSQLPARIQQAHEAHATAQSARDVAVISLIVPHVEQLLADMWTVMPPPTTGELILVPAAAVPPGWKLSNDSRDDGDAFTIKRCVRVEAAVARGEKGGGFEKSSEKGFEKGFEKMDGETGGGSGRGQHHRGSSTRMEEDSRGPHSEFDEWGRWGGDATGGVSSSSTDKWNTGEWWWSDEDSAARMVRHLQPPAPPSSSRVPPASPQPALARALTQGNEPEKKSFIGRLFRSSDGSNKSGNRAGSASSTPAVSPIAPSKPRFNEPTTPETTMLVWPESLTFRQENELGIWESRSGWGIMVQVKVSR